MHDADAAVHRLYEGEAVTAIEALHYALNLPTSTVVTGCGTMEILNEAIQAVTTFKPMTESQIAAIHERVKPLAISGENEPWKSSSAYDKPRVAAPPYEA